jgi:hypothetical protein
MAVVKPYPAKMALLGPSNKSAKKIGPPREKPMVAVVVLTKVRVAVTKSNVPTSVIDIEAVVWTREKKLGPLVTLPVSPIAIIVNALSTKGIPAMVPDPLAPLCVNVIVAAFVLDTAMLANRKTKTKNANLRIDDPSGASVSRTNLCIVASTDHAVPLGLGRALFFVSTNR